MHIDELFSSLVLEKRFLVYHLLMAPKPFTISAGEQTATK